MAQRPHRAPIDQPSGGVAQVSQPLLDGSPTPAWINFRNSIVYINDAGLAALGTGNRAGILGRSPFDFIDPAAHALVRRRMARVLRGARAATVEQSWRRAGGERFDAEVTAWPVPFAGGIAIVVAFVDISHRTETARHLAKTRAHLEELSHAFEMTQGMIRALDGRILTWTRAAETLYGWQRKQAVGRVSTDLLCTEFPRDVKQIEADLLRDGLWDGELKQRRRDGSTVWVASHWALVRDDAGQPRSVVEVNNDVTGHRVAEEALAASEHRLELAQAAARIGTWDWDVQANVTTCSIDYPVLYGLPRGSSAPDSDQWLQSIHPDDRARVQSALNDALHGRAPYDMEFRVIWPDGSLHWLLGKGQVFRDPSDTAVRMLGVNMEITERKTAEDALRDSEERFLRFMSFLPSVAFIKDRSGRFLYVNPVLEKMTSRGGERCVGSLPEEFGPQGPVFRQGDEEVLRTGTSVTMEETLLVAGQQRHFQVVKFSIPNSQGGASTIGGIALDTTETRTAAEKLRALSASLISAQEDERRRISRELHDDLTQRLALLAIDLGRIASEPDQSRVRTAKRIRAVQKSAIEVSEHARHIAHELHPSILDDLGTAMALRSYAAEFSEREGIRVAFSSRRLPSTIKREIASCIYAVAKEALRNVSKHARCKKATLALEGLPGAIRLTISDNGVGFRPDSLSAAVGLGVVNMRERVRSAGGTLFLESAPGKGTRIIAEVPAEVNP